MTGRTDRICDLIDGTTDEELEVVFIHLCNRVVQAGPMKFIQALEADEDGSFDELQAWFVGAAEDE